MENSEERPIMRTMPARRSLSIGTEEKKVLTESDFDTRSKVSQRIGEHLMDLDQMATTIMQGFPSVSSEMLYRMQLNKVSKVWAVMIVLGILLVLTAVMWSF